MLHFWIDYFNHEDSILSTLMGASNSKPKSKILSCHRLEQIKVDMYDFERSMYV